MTLPTNVYLSGRLSETANELSKTWDWYFDPNHHIAGKMCILKVKNAMLEAYETTANYKSHPTDTIWHIKASFTQPIGENYLAGQLTSPVVTNSSNVINYEGRVIAMFSTFNGCNLSSGILIEVPTNQQIIRLTIEKANGGIANLATKSADESLFATTDKMLFGIEMEITPVEI